MAASGASATVRHASCWESLSGLQIPPHLVEAFRQGLGEIGYVEGHNLTFEYRSASGDYDRLALGCRAGMSAFTGSLGG